jgi:hypothetical protein
MKHLSRLPLRPGEAPMTTVPPEKRIEDLTPEEAEEWAWLQKMIALEEERGELPPGGASGGPPQKKSQ